MNGSRKQKYLGSAVILAIAMGVGLSPLSWAADEPAASAPKQPEVQRDRKDLHQDRKEVRSDRKEIKKDRKEVRQDKKKVRRDKKTKR